MVLSYHPLFEGDLNLSCAGREPGPEDLQAIRKARAVVLPQGCSQTLYQMAAQNCPHVFPNYEARFRYPGKLKQAGLFMERGLRFPKTRTFPTLSAFHKGQGEIGHARLEYPFVFKFDWGGEGDFVFPVFHEVDFRRLLDLAETYEKTGQSGFLIQTYLPAGGRSLRVVVIHDRLISYWRVNEGKDFYGNLKSGGSIDDRSDPDLQQAGREAVRSLCAKTGINLAGIDLIFPMGMTTDPQGLEPYFLEINYFFGRKGLGGSEAYYRLLIQGIHSWLQSKGLYVKQEGGQDGRL